MAEDNFELVKTHTESVAIGNAGYFFVICNFKIKHCDIDALTKDEMFDLIIKNPEYEHVDEFPKTGPRFLDCGPKSHVASSSNFPAQCFTFRLPRSHGPFLIEKIRPKHYKKIAYNKFDSLLRDLSHKSSTNEPMLAVENLLLKAKRAQIYKFRFATKDLRGPNAAFTHYSEFQEFVLIEPDPRELTFVIFGFD